MHIIGTHPIQVNIIYTYPPFPIGICHQHNIGYQTWKRTSPIRFAAKSLSTSSFTAWCLPDAALAPWHDAFAWFAWVVDPLQGGAISALDPLLAYLQVSMQTCQCIAWIRLSDVPYIARLTLPRYWLPDPGIEVLFIYSTKWRHNAW